MARTIRYVLSIDKLVLNLKSEQAFNFEHISTFTSDGNIHRVNERVSLRHNPILTTNYLRQWEVWVDDVLIGMLATDCRLPQSQPMQRFTFDNKVLYTQPGWFHYLTILTKATGLEIFSVAHLELALDLQFSEYSLGVRAWLNSLDDIYKYLPREHNTDVRFKLKNKLRVTEKAGTYYFGNSVTSSRGGEKQVKVYLKDTEIQYSGKHYISELHHLNGLDVNSPILRIEVTYGDKYFYRLASLAVEDLLLPELLESLFVDAASDCFRFCDVASAIRDKHRNLKYSQVILMSFDFLNQQPVARAKRQPATEGIDRADLTTVKRLTHEWIKYEAPETLDELRRFTQANHAPTGISWKRKVEYYARQYREGSSTQEMARIDGIAHMLN